MPLKAALLEVNVLKHFVDTRNEGQQELRFLDSSKHWKHLGRCQGDSHSRSKGGCRPENKSPSVIQLVRSYQRKLLFPCSLPCTYQNFPKNLSFFPVYLRNKFFIVSIRGACPAEIGKQAATWGLMPAGTASLPRQHMVKEHSRCQTDKEVLSLSNLFKKELGLGTGKKVSLQRQ